MNSSSNFDDFRLRSVSDMGLAHAGMTYNCVFK